MFKPNWAKRNTNKIKFLQKKINFENCSLKNLYSIQKFLLNLDHVFQNTLVNQRINRLEIDSPKDKLITDIFFEFEYDERANNLKENFVMWKLNFSIKLEEKANEQCDENLVDSMVFNSNE